MNKTKCVFLFFIIGMIALACSTQPFFTQSPSGLPDVISVEGGKISGAVLGENKDVRAFKGIPYAKAPVGHLRWKPPQPVESWEGVRQCVDFGCACLQPDIMKAWGIDYGKLSEDCLFLNVWTSAKSADEKRPVMMWIHGGGNVAGASQHPSNDGEALARKGVVVVSINYRLGIFGYFAHPRLSKESKQNVSGNYGLLDMIAALKWIQHNIKAFGGDPDRVTIFGESAGATNVCYLMASPFAKALFHGAIAESGNAFRTVDNRHLRERWYDQEPMEKQGERIVKDLGYSETANLLSELRVLNAEKLLEGSKATMGAGPGNRFTPVIDGWALPDDIMAIFDGGKQNIVPLIVGSNADEMTIFITKPPFDNIGAYREYLNKTFGKSAEAVLALYPANEPNEIRKAMCDTLGDASQVSAARRFVRAMAKAEEKNAYLYHYTMVWPGRMAANGAFHSGEMIFVFDNVNKSKEPFEEKHHAFAKVMSGYWVQFAATGNPNKPGSVEWPAYELSKDQYIEFGEVVRIGQGLRKEKCDFWDNYIVDRRKNR